MNRLLYFILFSILSYTYVSSQTYVEFDRIAWSDAGDGALDGLTQGGFPWDATVNGNCDATGSFGVNAGRFVVEDWEGVTCGCECVPSQPTPSCGANDNTILIPATVVAGYCRVRIRFNVQATGVECGTMNDQSPNDYITGCPIENLGNEWGGTDGMTISASSQSGDIDGWTICGTQNSGSFDLELDVDPVDFVAIIINVGTQDENESYSIGDIVFEGIERQFLQVVPTLIDGASGTEVCENSGAPLEIQTSITDPTVTYQWSGPNGYSTNDPNVFIDPITPALAGTYSVTITESNGCSVSESIDISVLSAMDGACLQQPFFSESFSFLCNNDTLPSADDNGVAGTWTPSAVLSSFGDTSIQFTFTPDDPTFTDISFDVNISDENALDIFGIQPAELPVFCNSSTERFNLVEIFQLDTTIQLQVNGEGDLFPFIPETGGLLEPFQDEFESISFAGKQTGMRQFFVEGLTVCGTNLLTFQLEIIEKPEPIIIDTALCEGEFFEVEIFDFGSITLFPGIDTIITSGDGQCDTLLIADVDLSPAGEMRNGMFYPGSTASTSCGDIVYFYDTIVGGVNGVFIVGEIGMPPLGENFDTVFTESYTGQFTMPFPAANGCDSIVNIALSITPTTLVQDTITICQNADTTLTFQGNEFTLNSANRFEQFPIAGNCSFQTFFAELLPLERDTIQGVLREGQDTIINGVLFDNDNPAQSLTLPGGSANGCDVITYVEFTFLENRSEVIDRRICPGESVQIGPFVVTESIVDSVFILEGQASTGGDSIVTATVTVVVPQTTRIDTSICEGDFFEVDVVDIGTITLFPNTDTVITSGDGACDTLLIANVGLNPNGVMRNGAFYPTSTQSTSCGEVIYFYDTLFNGQNGVFLVGPVGEPPLGPGFDTVFLESYTGRFTLPIPASNGCDSIVNVALSITPTVIVEEVISLCADRDTSLTFQGTPFTLSASNPFERFPIAGNCSFQTFTADILPLERDTITGVLKEGQDTTIAGVLIDINNPTETVTSPGASANGCDAVTFIDFTFLENRSEIINRRICPGESVEIGPFTIAESIVDSVFILEGGASTGGDSIITATITVVIPETVAVNETICREDNFNFRGETFDTARTSGFVNSFDDIANCPDTIFNIQIDFFDAPDIVRDTMVCAGTMVSYPEFGVVLSESNPSESVVDVTDDGCDQNVTLTATFVQPIFRDLGDTTICAGEIFEFNNQSYTTSQQIAAVNVSAFGCDSTTSVNLIVLANEFTELDESACEGSGFTFGSEFISIGGTYFDTLIAFNGCDSVVQLNLTIDPPIQTDSMVTICDGQSFDFNGLTLERDTSIVVLGTTPEGCNTELNFTLDVLDPIVTILETVAPTCADGSTLVIGDSTYTTTGVYEQTFISSEGCDSIVRGELILPDSIFTNISRTICEGDPLVLNGVTLTEPGIQPVSFFTANGCDSIVFVDLTVIPPFFDTIDVILCPGEDTTLLNNAFNNANAEQLTTYDTVTVSSSAGCDTSYTLNITRVGIGLPVLNIDRCFGDTVRLGDQIFTESFVGDVTYVDDFGCLRTDKLNLNIFQDIGFDIGEQVLCSGEGFEVGDSLYTEAGDYTVVLPLELPFSGAVCDSSVTFSISFAEPINESLDPVQICQGENFLFGSSALIESGVYYDTLTAASTGCDSIVELTLTVIEPVRDTIEQVLCPGEEITVMGVTFGNGTDREQTETIIDSVQSTSGCDTTIVTILTYVRGAPTVIESLICPGDFLEIGDSTFTESGFYMIPFPNPSFPSCDSMVRLNLTVIADPQTDLGTINRCFGEGIVIGDTLVTANGPHSITLMSGRQNDDGMTCDSVINFVLNVTPENRVDLTQRICQGDTFTVGGMSYTETGMYTDTLIAASGCDSIVTLDLMVEEVMVIPVDTSLCSGENLIIGGQSLSTTMMTEISIPSSRGCDSIVYQVNLEVLDEINTVVTEPFLICPSGDITIAGQVYNAPGNYEQVLTASTGCDSTIRFTIEIRSITMGEISRQICTGGSFDFGGELISESGTYMDTITSGDGCDSIVTLTLDVVDQIETSFDVSICSGDSFDFAGQSFDQSGAYNDTLMSSIGCDSIVTLNLTVLPELMADVSSIIGACEGASNGSFVINPIPSSTGPYEIMGLDGIGTVDALPLTVSGLGVGIYNFIVVDANGCMAEGIAEISEDRSNALQINSTTIDPSGQYQLNIIFDGVISSISWDSIPGLSCYDCPGPSVFIEESTTFTVTVTDEEGCVSTASISLSVDGLGNIYVPTIFNPESEDGNDRFFITGEDSDVFYDMWVYDRWGNLVFSIEGAAVNERSLGWTGRWKDDRDAAMGVYVYTSRVYKANGIERTFKGDITLVR